MVSCKFPSFLVAMFAFVSYDIMSMTFSWFIGHMPLTACNPILRAGRYEVYILMMCLVLLRFIASLHVYRVIFVKYDIVFTFFFFRRVSCCWYLPDLC